MTIDKPSSNYRTTATIRPQVIRPGRSSLRMTFQLAADLTMRQEPCADRMFAGAAQVAMDWFAAKLPQALPKQARDMASFDLDHDGQQQLSCVSLPGDGLWSVRLIQPDAPFMGRSAVAGRTWTTELALNRSGESIRLGIRVMCASAPYATEPITPHRPHIVIDLAQKFGLNEIRPLDGQPWILHNENDLRALFDLLIDTRRTMPVILLTQSDQRQEVGAPGTYALDYAFLAQRTLSLAHVVCMPVNLSFAWTEMVGRVWSAFRGAIRTYYPRLSLNDDSPFAHPRILPDRVMSWHYGDQDGESGFASFLIDRMAEHAAARSVDFGNCLFFADARTRRAEVLREKAMHELRLYAGVNEAAKLQDRIEALQKAHVEETEALKAQVAETQRDAEEYDVLASQYKQEAEQTARESRSLRCQNDGLRSAFETKTGRSADADTQVPDNYDDMPEWVEDHLAGRLILHPRAIQGIKKASYENIALVYGSLLLLARGYRNMRLGYETAKEQWEEGLGRLRLHYGPSITRERAGEQGETYFVRYPLGSNQKRLLELHLRVGSTKDERHCLAIYFFWDQESSQVVVGWLPSHLDTRAT